MLLSSLSSFPRFADGRDKSIEQCKDAGLSAVMWGC